VSLHFEDFAPGLRFTSGAVTLDLAAIRAFAGEFDPQHFHLDPETAPASAFGALVASGWQTVTETIHLALNALPDLAPGAEWADFQTLSWNRPVRPGDTLHVSVEVASADPAHGLVGLTITTLDAADQPVQVIAARLKVPRR
jgi:acyl dehydratase